MKKAGRKTYILALAACLLLTACQLGDSEKKAESNVTAESNQPEEKQVTEPNPNTEAGSEKTGQPNGQGKEEQPEPAPKEGQNEPPAALSRQSKEMLEYTKAAWPEELEEALKEVDFSAFHFDVNEPRQIEDVNSLFVLANKANYFPEDFEPIELIDPQSKHAGNQTRRKLRKVAADAIDELIAAAKNEGLDIQTVSGYRTIAYQKILYKSNVERQGLELANRYSSKPGHSEHHTGLCMDVSSASVGFDLVEKYSQTKEGKWLAENSHFYGFVIRYPEGKDNITGYSYEPWHIRYLGVPLATYLYQTGLCYEEFLALQQGKQPEEIVIK